MVKQRIAGPEKVRSDRLSDGRAGSLRAGIRCLLFLLGALLAAGQLEAQQAGLPEEDREPAITRLSAYDIAKLPDTTFALAPFTSVYIDRMKWLNLDSVRGIWRNGGFTPLEELVYPPKFESGKYYYWLQFQLNNTSSDSLEIILRMPRIDSSFYYQLVNGQLERSVLFGNRLSLEAIGELGLDISSNHSIPIQMPPGGQYQVFLKAKDILYLTAKLNPVLEKPYVFFKNKAYKEFYLLLGDAYFLGILFFVCLFTLLQYVQHKDRAFLFYALYVGLLFLLNWLVFEENNNTVKVLWRLSTNYHYVYIPLHIAIYFSYTLFVYYFINERNRYPFLGSFIRWVQWILGGYLVVTIALSLLTEVRYSWILHYYARIGVSILMLTLLGYLWKIGSRLAYYLIFGALSLLVLSIIAPALFSLTIMDQLWMGKDYTSYLAQAGVLVELLFFSLGLGYKQYLSDQAKISAQKEKEQIEQLEAFKDRFYTNITHEFRTPLTVILGLTDDLETQTGDAFPQIRKRTALIRRNGHELLQLVNQLLDLSKLESGHLKWQTQQGEVITFIKYVCESFHSLAREKDIELIVHPEVASLWMDFDPQKLSGVIANLLSNAIKFTDAGRQVGVSVKNQNGNTLLIEVKDTGIGISEEQLPLVFDRFYRVANPLANQMRGTGVGLALTKELVELMDGTITVESEPGKGSVFTVLLPILREAPLSATAVEELASAHQVAAHPVMPDPSFDGARGLPLILLIEDNQDLAWYLHSCLQDAYQVLSAPDGRKDLDLAFEYTPDLIISDVMMPEKDGFEVCKTLKTDERTNHIPVILLTAKVTLDDRLTGLSQGADAYLAKPFEKAELLIRTEKLLDVRRTLQLKYQDNLQDDKEPLPAPEKDAFIRKAEQLILEHLEEDTFSVHELAGLLFLSRSQVHRKIKALTGLSTTIFIRRVRLQKASKLLADDHLTVAEVAFQVGFKSPVYFSQVFKDAYGESPTDYRN